MKYGWTVEVENSGGVLLYAARFDDPIEAENVVRKIYNIPDDFDVIAARPLSQDAVERLRIEEGETRGPM